MNGFCENVSFGSHADRAVCGKRGLVRAVKTHGSQSALTVATNPIFMRGVELEKLMGHSYLYLQGRPISRIQS